MPRDNFASMPPARVADKGDQWLAAGNARDALRAFKFLKKSGYEPGIVTLRMFQAYLVRYQQLMEKKMANEAEVVLAAALEFFPAGGSLPLETLEAAIRLLPLENAVTLYRDALFSMEAVPEMERLIGTRAVLEDNLDLLNGLPGHLALVKEKECLEQATVSMNAGHWDQAVKELNRVSRKSPFAEIKIFAKLMAAFALQDKTGVQKALALLDKGFSLTSLQELLGAYAAEDGLPQASGNGETARLLWGQPFLNQGYAGDLKQAVAENNPVKITRAVAGLTARLDSPDQASAVEFLAEIAGQGVVDVTKEPDHVLALFKKLPLPDPHAMFARFAAPRAAFLTEFALPFWRQIEQLFSDPEDQKLARGLILAKIAERMVNDPDIVFELQDGLGRFFSAIGCGDKVCFDDVGDGADSHLVVAAVLEQALGFDPENPMGYELLLTVPFDSPALRRALPPLLESAAGVFSHDPRPYLRLAQIYLHKSAVRKAEGVLKKAFARAPHDNSVLEQYALCHVATACKNIKSRKYDLAFQDLEAAEKMGVPSLGIYIVEKRLLCTCAQTLKFSKKLFEGMTRGLNLGDTLRVLALFKLDLEDPDHGCPDAPRGLAAVFNSHKKRIKELTSQGLAALLKPLPMLGRGLYSKHTCAALFLGKRATVLNGLSDTDLMDIALDLAKYGHMDAVVDQLAKRVNMDKDEDGGRLMQFLYRSLCHIRGDSVSSQVFLNLIDSVSPPLKEKLRSISRQVAAIAPQQFRTAYEQFDFTLLDRPGFMDDMPFDFNSREMDELAEIMDRARQDGMGEFLDSFMDRINADGMGAALESIVGEIMENFDPDEYFDDDVYDIDLKEFKVRKVFGNRVNADQIHDLVHELVQDSLYLRDARGADEVTEDSRDFIKSCDRLLAALRQGGLDSSNDFRRTGKQFCQNIAYGREILLAFQTASRRSGLPVSMDLKSFILGMKQGG